MSVKSSFDLETALIVGRIVRVAKDLQFLARYFEHPDQLSGPHGPNLVALFASVVSENGSDAITPEIRDLWKSTVVPLG